MKFLFLALLPAMSMGITNFGDCDTDPSLACFTDTDCTAPLKCATNAAGAAPAAGLMGCCFDSTATTSTVASVTTVATTVSSTSCVDKLNPLTGVSDCPARATLCTNTVYLDVMRDQCPRTCGFCTGTGTATNTTITSCVDRVNPNTLRSDCPSMKAYCNNTIYKPLMTIQCPATCGFCTSG